MFQDTPNIPSLTSVKNKSGSLETHPRVSWNRDFSEFSYWRIDVPNVHEEIEDFLNQNGIHHSSEKYSTENNSTDLITPGDSELEDSGDEHFEVRKKLSRYSAVSDLSVNNLDYDIVKAVPIITTDEENNNVDNENQCLKKQLTLCLNSDSSSGSFCTPQSETDSFSTPEEFDFEMGNLQSGETKKHKGLKEAKEKEKGSPRLMRMFNRDSDVSRAGKAEKISGRMTTTTVRPPPPFKLSQAKQPTPVQAPLVTAEDTESNKDTVSSESLTNSSHQQTVRNAAVSTSASYETPPSRGASLDSVFSDTSNGLSGTTNHLLQAMPLYLETHLDSHSPYEDSTLKGSSVGSCSDIFTTNTVDVDDVDINLMPIEFKSESSLRRSDFDSSSVVTGGESVSYCTSIDDFNDSSKDYSLDFVSQSSISPKLENEKSPVLTHSPSFTISRHKKIELHPTKYSAPTTPSGTMKMNSSDHVLNDDSASHLRRHSSISDVPINEPSMVLRKVASLTLDKATIEEKVSKPKFVPEKLDFQIYEKFEGQMLINWYCSAFTEDHYLHYLLSKQDLKIMATQFCTYLLAAGVLRQIEDADAPCESLFRPDLMYYWTHSEAPTQMTPLPGKLSTHMWPPPLSLVEGLSTRESAGLKYTEAEYTDESLDDLQAVILGIQKERKDATEDYEKRHEAAIDNIRSEYSSMLSDCEAKIKKLEREVEKYQTLADIQALTERVQADFPIEVNSTVQTTLDSTPTIPPPPPPPPPPPLPFECISALPPASLPSSCNAAVPPPPPPPPPPPFGVGIPPPPPPPPPPQGFGPPLPPPPPPPPPMFGSNVAPPPPPPPCPGMMPSTSLPPLSSLSSSPKSPHANGPTPLPPPPPGGWFQPQTLVLRKLPVTPKSPMKPLYWNRIQTPVTPVKQEVEDSISFWNKLEEVDVVNWEEFTDLFSRQVVEKKPAAKSKTTKSSKQKAAKVLDSKRSQMVGILVSSLHLEITEVENAVYNFDTSVLDLEALQAIYEARGTNEELLMIKEQLEKFPDIPLDKPDQFVYDLSEIPHFADRIACFMFQSSFAEGICAVESRLNNLKLICHRLMTGESVQQTFGLILALGNYMNGGNRTRGQADGFGLDILPKLRDVKSKDSSITLLHFIVKKYIEKFDKDAGSDKAQLPMPEPSDIERAASIKFEDLEVDLMKLKTELNSCEKRTEKVIAASREEHLEPFKTNMTKFLSKATEEHKEQVENLNECKLKFIEVLVFFQWKGKISDTQPKEFFTAWITFCSDFKDIWKKEQQRILKQQLDEAQKKVKRMKEEKKTIVTKAKERSGLKAKLARKGMI